MEGDRECKRGRRQFERKLAGRQRAVEEERGRGRAGEEGEEGGV